MPPSAHRPLLLASMLCLLASGACSLTSLNNSVFSCKTDSDCASGEKCLESICRSSASLASGSPSAGQCSPACNSAEQQVCCGSACVNLSSDNGNCGECGNACNMAVHESCYAGTCQKEMICDDGLDNNNDGLTDCQDTLGCPAGTGCRGGGHCCQGACAFENTAAACSDGMDNDCNGLTDCQDTGCLGQTCGMGMICDSMQNCSAGCYIGGKFYATGDASSDAPCLVCDPTQNTHDWSAAAVGTTTAKCISPDACDGSGTCRRATGQPCAGDGDCASKTCTAGLCL